MARQVSNRSPRGTTRLGMPGATVRRMRAPATVASQTSLAPNANRTAPPGRTVTNRSRPPAGSKASDGGVTGWPWAPSRRTPGTARNAQVLVEMLRSSMVTQMVPAAPSLPRSTPRSAEASHRPVAGRPDGTGAEGAVTGA